MKEKERSFQSKAPFILGLEKITWFAEFHPHPLSYTILR